MERSKTAKGFELGPRQVAFVGLVTVSLCAALASLRLYYNISFAEPLHYVSSGDEQSSLFAIWRVAEGLSPYTDRFAPPFTLASYNWLYYKVYGDVFVAASALFSLDDSWVPTVSRLFTLLGWAVSGLFSYLVLALVVAQTDGRWFRVLAAGFALLIAIGPLVGFWLITVRPDIWAFALEIIGFWVFVKWYPEKRPLAVGGFAAFFYAAWAFKQTAVLVGGGIGLYLLVRRDWRMAFLLAGLMIVAWGLTFLLAGADYRDALLFSGVPLEYTVTNGLRNLFHWAGKFAPGVAGAAVLVLLIAANAEVRQTVIENQHVVLGLSGLAVSVGLALLASTQTGAAENYFFQAAFFSAYLTIAGMATLGVGQSGPSFQLAAGVIAGWLVLSIAVGAALTGVVGIKDLTGQHRSYKALKACLDDVPRPLFVNEVYLSLPWMTPRSEPYVLSFFYERERVLDQPFDGDGIGGRIRNGHFAALAFWQGSVTERFDGASLKKYEKKPLPCGNLDIWLRK